MRAARPPGIGLAATCRMMARPPNPDPVPRVEVYFVGEQLPSVHSLTVQLPSVHVVVVEPSAACVVVTVAFAASPPASVNFCASLAPIFAASISTAFVDPDEPASFNASFAAAS